MGCSNARLLVQAPLTSEAGSTDAPNPFSSSPMPTSPLSAASDSHAASTRMHLTGVDLVVERNGSYTLLLTPKTHKQLMPYVLRKKRFRILVDKSRSHPASSVVASNEPLINERLMETSRESKFNSKNHREASTVESIEQLASDEMNRAKARFVGGRSIDRGNPEDDDVNIQSDDEGMIEEIVTTVEEDKDLECKVKKKIETKKTIAEDPETHSKITKVVKTEMTEVTRTITLNDQHDLARAKRELGIDDVNRFLPSGSSWSEPVREERYEIVSPTKAPLSYEKPALAEATSVGRGAVVETVAAPAVVVGKPKKKKKSGLCSCTRAAAEDEVPPPPPLTKVPIPERIKESPLPTTTTKPAFDSDIQGQALVSSDIKQLIIEKKFLLIDYIHSTLFSPAQLFASPADDLKARKISSRILDLLRYDRCSSWSQMFEQLQEEYPNHLRNQSALQPMLKTYENLFTQKQSNLLNTFSTIHHANDLSNISENHDYQTMLRTYLHEPDQQTTISKAASGEAIPERAEEQLDEKVPMDAEPIYNEEQLIKMLADVSQHKPITLAEAIAYQYIDIEDPKLGLASETIERLKNLFRPLPEENSSNVIRVKRAGEYLTDVNLAELNPFEKLNLTEPSIYQLQPSFEPTLDFNEKQFRALTETISKNKEQYEQLQFDIGRTSLPIDDLKESSTNDFSQSDSGYSMTTATYESLASKIKIEFEPISQEVSTARKRDELSEEEKVDLDKATPEELEHYQLNQDLIQLIKSDFNGTDKTVGQAILSRELRLESVDPNDVARLKALGIDKEQARILSAFFFPKQTRIIAYSPEPGRFVEAQTTFNPDYPSHKTDTTVIQIQEKQLSSDHHAMQRQIFDERTSPISSKSIQESELIVSAPVAETSTGAKKDKSPPIERKKRKSMSSASLLSCFKSKKPKAGTEQQGQATVSVNETVTISKSVVPEKPMIDYAILPDGKRIYIDAFRQRPGMDMSYRPNDFDQRFILPTEKPAEEYEQLMASEIVDEPVQQKVQVLEEKPFTPIIEPVLVQSKVTPEVKSPGLELHAAAVRLPEVELVKPGPLPTFPTSKGKKSTGGLCASCFGGKSAEKRKKDALPAPIPAPLEPKSTVIQEDPPAPLPDVQPSIETTPQDDAPILPRVNIDTFKERTFDKTYESLAKKGEEKITTAVELNQSAPVSPNKPDVSIFSQVNIDTFKERTFVKGVEGKKPKVLSEVISEQVVPTRESPEKELIAPAPVPSSDESTVARVNIDTFRERTFPPPIEKPRQSSPSPPVDNVVPVKEPLLASEPASPPAQPLKTDGSLFSQVNIDTFKERTFEKNPQLSPKVEEPLKPSPIEEPQDQSPVDTPAVAKDGSLFSQVNIDTFKERTFDKTYEGRPKSPEKPVPVEEPHYQLPTNEPVLTSDTSIFSRVNIDIFKERSYVKSDEPHYQQPSGEPVPPVENEYAVAEHHEENTYETPPPVDIPSKEQLISDVRMLPASSVIDKSSGDFHASEVKTKESKKKKKKAKSAAKSSLLSTVFRSNGRPTAAPAFDLPSIDLDLSANSAPRPPHRHDSDPLRVPNITLPAPDVQLPSYTRPEADLNGGQRPLTSEFAIPVVELPTIPNLDLPTTDKNKKVSDFPVDPMKVPHVQLPQLQFSQSSLKSSKPIVETPVTPTIETGLALASPVEDMLSIQTDHKNFPIETDYAVKVDSTLPEFVADNAELSIKPEPLSIAEKYSITDTRFVQTSESSINIDKPTSEELKSSAPPSNYSFPLPSPDPVVIIPKGSSPVPPSFEDDVPAAPSKLVPARQHSETLEKQPIATKKKSSTLSFCSCFGKKSSQPRPSALTAPVAALPAVEMPLPSSNISSTLKNKGPLRAPSADLPSVDLTPKETESIHLPSLGAKRPETSQSPREVDVATLVKHAEEQSISGQSAIPKTSADVNKSKAPTMNIPPRSDSYLDESRSDSGLEAIVASHVNPSSTFGTLEEIPQHPSVSSGFGSEVLDSITTKGYTLPGLKETQEDFTGPITMNDEIYARQEQLKQSLGDAISDSMEDFKDRKALDKMLSHAIELIKKKDVTNYGELQRKLTIEHKDEAYLADPIVRSLHWSIEKQGLDQVEKPEFLSAIRDMVRPPGKQTSDTAKKEATSVVPTQMAKSSPPSPTVEKKVSHARSCFTCARTKSKSSLPSNTISSGLLDDRRRAQLNSHRSELGDILRDHLQSAQPPIRKFADHPKETEKIVRKSLTLLNQPKILSYEQMRHELKTEHKSTFYLVDPIVDVIRDTLDHCDLTQMTDKTNLDILHSHITQTAQLYNHQNLLLSSEESTALKSNQLSWLQAYLIEQESKEKKLKRKQSKELTKILARALEILSLNVVATWEEVALQLQREFPKAHDLCQRAVDLLKQGQRDGLLSLQQPPNQPENKRRPSSLITERARQNLKNNRAKIAASVKNLFVQQTEAEQQLDLCLTKTLTYLEEHKSGQFKDYHELKEQLKRDFPQQRGELIEQIVDVIEQAHATNQFDDIDKPEVQALMRDRLSGKPLVIKEMYVSLPPRRHPTDDSNRYLSNAANGDRTLNSSGTGASALNRIGRGLSWREANERARILFYRGKHPAIHYDEQAAAFDVRMLLETASGGTQEIPVTDSDVHELLNSCGVQWDGVNLISLVDHSEDVVRAAEQAALRVIREKGLVDLRTPPPSDSDTGHQEDAS